MQCPVCATPAPDDNLFCENCGQRLNEPAPAPTGCVCGAAAGEVDAEGFCLRCGLRVVRPASDHIEQAISPLFAAVSDRGTRHDRNEDRFAIGEADGVKVLVVCDGVSASRQSELASAAAAETILAELLNAVGQKKLDKPVESMLAAMEAAVARLGDPELPSGGSGRPADDNPPSTTAVAALVAQGTATIGWVGDSRAYWIDGSGAHALTRDHSWLNDVVASGEMTAGQAASAPQAHAIVRWIGADAGDAAEAEVVQHRVTAPGTLLLCTDGLWNYAASEDVFHGVFQQATTDGADALTAARRLVQFAIGRGGLDNITVALLRFEAPPSSSSEDGAALH